MRSLQSAGGAGVSTSTLGIGLLGDLRELSLLPPRLKLLIVEHAENGRGVREETIPRRRSLGMPEGRGGRKLADIIKPAGREKV
jgi:hypothetical protein